MNLKYKEGSVAFIINELNEIVVIIRGDTISVPGGKREQDESGLDCAVRETFEETGIVLNPKLSTILHAGICGANGEGQKAVPYWVSAFVFFVKKQDILFDPVEKDKVPFWVNLELFEKNNAFFQYNFDAISKLKSIL